MGTRGAFGVVVGGVEKIGYNQYDSYPSGKGIEVLQWLRGVVERGEIDKVRKLATALRVVSNERKPTRADIKRLQSYTDLGVSEQSTDDWYCLTRAAHGDIGATLKSGYVLDSSTFPLDSLFCEWAYIIDFDAGTLEVHEGFQTSPPTEGRFAGRISGDPVQLDRMLANARSGGSDYWEVAQVASWPLSDLPDNAAMLELERTDDDEGLTGVEPCK